MPQVSLHTAAVFVVAQIDVSGEFEDGFQAGLEAETLTVVLNQLSGLAPNRSNGAPPLWYAGLLMGWMDKQASTTPAQQQGGAPHAHS